MKELTEHEIAANKTRIMDALLATGRENANLLMDDMEDMGFFTAPCSSQYHLSCEGGLAQHSLNVADTLVTLADALCKSSERPSYHSMVLVALLHDLGKCGDFGKPMYVENILKTGKRSESKPFTSNSDLMFVPHEVRSVIIAERRIGLTEEEEHAILFHNGTYTGLGYEWKGKEQPLDLLLHWADLWCSRITEKEEGVAANVS